MSANRVKRLVVLIEGRVAGSLEQDANGRLAFEYDTTYPSNATPLSPSLPVSSERFTDRSISPFIAGLLPDNEQVLDRWSSQFGLRSKSAFALLSHIGLDCAGAVQFVTDADLDAVTQGDLVELGENDIETMLRDLRQNPYTWQQPMGARSGQFSLAGAQSKFALHRDGDVWARPSGQVPTTHILKPSIPGIPDHDLNEHLCLRAATRLGLLAAESELLRFRSERVVVVERFDRRRVGGDLRRVHQVDMCQARSVMPDRKYQSDGGPGPLDIIETLRAHAAGVADVERFVHSLIFNWVIAGTDAHAKNFGLLLSGPSARLTPLYDLASATVLDDWNPHKWELAMRINGKSRFRYLTAADWRKFANAVGVDASDVIATAIRYADSIGDALLDSGNELSSDVVERQPITRLIDSVTEHAQSIRRTLGRG